MLPCFLAEPLDLFSRLFINQRRVILICAKVTAVMVKVVKKKLASKNDTYVEIAHHFV